MGLQMNMRFRKLFLCLCITIIFVCFSSCIKQQSSIVDNQSVMTTIETDTAAEGESGFISSTLPNTTIQEDFESTISEKNSSAPALTSSKSLITSNELSTPQKLLFISNNNENVCSLDTTTQVMAKVNAYINSGTIRAMRMAVSDDTISNIKSNQKCIEIIYETTQSLHTSAINGASADYKFNKILLVLNGDYKGLLFFEQSGTYLSGPIKGSSEKYISDILTICS